MKKIVLIFSTLIFSVSIVFSGDISTDDFKNTRWVGNDTDEERNASLVINNDLSWLYSFVDEDDEYQEFDGDSLKIDTLFGGDPRPDNPLVLIPLSEGELAAPPFAIVENDGEITLVVDELVLENQKGKPTELELGEYVTYSDTESDYDVLRAKVRASSTSNAEGTATDEGCYKTKEDTGQPFPYKYNYTHFEESVSVPTHVEQTDESWLISMYSLDKKIKEAIERVREHISVSDDCETEERVEVELKVYLPSKNRTIKARIFLQEDSGGFYVNQAWGKIYIADERVDFIKSK